MKRVVPLAAALLALAGCRDSIAPAASDPAAPQATHSDPADPSITRTDLAALGVTGVPMDINNRGQVVGGGQECVGFDLGIGSGRAFLWSQAEGVRDLGTLGGSWSCAVAISDAGHVVGRSATADGAVRAFLWTAAGGMRDLGTLPGGTASAARDVNSAGLVVGSSDTPEGGRAVVWLPDGTMRSLGTPSPWVNIPYESYVDPREGGRSYRFASSVNARGQVVGIVILPGTRGEPSPTSDLFVWTAEGGARVLFEFPGGADFPGISGGHINDQGIVVVEYVTPAGNHSMAVGSLGPSLSPFLYFCERNSEISNANVVSGTCGRGGPPLGLFGDHVGTAIMPDGTHRRLPTPPVRAEFHSLRYDAYAGGLNDAGQIVGFTHGGATLWTLVDAPAPLPPLGAQSAPTIVNLRADPVRSVYRPGEKACSGRYNVCLRFTVADRDPADFPLAVTIDWRDGSPVNTYSIPRSDIPLLAPHDFPAALAAHGPRNLDVEVAVTDKRGARTLQRIRLAYQP